MSRESEIRERKLIECETPVLFRDFMNNKNTDVDCVQIIDMEYGFCGAFKWKDNTIISLDGDTYTENMIVEAYKFFTNDISVFGETRKELCLDILVKEW